LAAGGLLILFGCADVDTRAGSDSAKAHATLRNGSGESVGQATFTQTDNGVQLSLHAAKLPSGAHGLHIHENGTCAPPDFESAGEHFNPAQRQHGFEVQGGPHMGDMRNLDVGENGEAATERPLEAAKLDSSDRSLIGRAIVIHEKPDDYKSQPAGDAGKRIACGVIERNGR
jgi:Cu-Zn family superoxide dismutase